MHARVFYARLLSANEELPGDEALYERKQRRMPGEVMA